MRDKDETKTTPLRTLNQGTIEGDATTVKVSKERKALREASKVKLLLVLLSVFVYVACFLLIYYTRDYGMGVVAVIPVVVVAWLYGCVPGIVAAVLTLPLNMFLNEYLGVEWIERMILRGASIQGTIALMLMGGAVGHLRDLNMRVKGELSHRKRAEEALKKAQDELEFRVKERTAELKKTKDHLDNIIESSLDCIIVTDDKGCITRVNKALLKLTGYEKEEIVGKSTMELSIPKEGTYETTTGEMVEIGEEHFNSALEIVEKLFEEGEIANWESYLLRKDKKIIPVGISMSLLYNEKGEVIGSIGINRDVTERKKIEKEVKEAKDFLENIFKTSADGLIIADASGVIIMANKSIASMLGYSPNELIGKTTSALNKGEMYRENASRFLTKLFEEGVITDYEFTWVKKDGNLIDVEVNAVLLRDHAGNDIGTVTTIRDITERKKTEEALRKSEERYKAMFENTSNAVAIYEAVDGGNNFIFVDFNRTGEIIDKIKREEVIGKSVLQVFPGVKDFGLFEVLKKVWSTGNPEHFPMAQYKDKRISGWRENFIYRLPSGEIVAIYTDETERMRAEEALRESHENLRSLAGRLQTIQEDERIRISREIHDELGEKLTALNMGLSWLREKLPHDQVVLTGKVNEMSGLINETIQTVQKMATDLRPSILDNLGISAAIEWEIEEFQKRAEIVCDLTMDPENITLDKDYSTALFRILQETLTNVARHANANMVEVSLKKFDSKIELEVKDNGKGISKEQIFVSQSLGLIGMQERAHSLNGKIDISGIQGRGTTVTVTIPLDEKGQSR